MRDLDGTLGGALQKTWNSLKCGCNFKDLEWFLHRMHTINDGKHARENLNQKVSYFDRHQNHPGNLLRDRFLAAPENLINGSQ